MTFTQFPSFYSDTLTNALHTFKYAQLHRARNKRFYAEMIASLYDSFVNKSRVVTHAEMVDSLQKINPNIRLYNDNGRLNVSF
jgi:hypothetical protein